MCRTLPRKEVRRVMHSAGPVCWYEHEAWNEGDLLGLGKEHHLYNTYLPIPSFLLSESPSLQGSQPTQVVAGCLAGHRLAALQMLLQTRSGAGTGRQHLLPPTITLLCQWFQEGWQRRGVFSEVLSFLRSRTLCQVGP